MAIQAPLNHLITDVHRPESTCIEVIQKNISSLQWKAIAMSTLEKVCYVALLAIITVVFAASYKVLALTQITPHLLAGMILTTPFLILAPTKLAHYAYEYYNLAQLESGVYLKLREIENWSEPEIAGFFETRRLNFGELPTSSLAQINAECPTKALLPLIARFNFYDDKINTIKRNYEVAKENTERYFAQKEAESGHLIDPEIKQKIRYKSECVAWSALEERAIPFAFKAATLLQLIENPSTTDLDVTPLSNEIPGVGTCKPRSYSERAFGKICGDDNYFVFQSNIRRPAISHAEIQSIQMKPSEIKQLLYPRIRA